MAVHVINSYEFSAAVSGGSAHSTEQVGQMERAANNDLHSDVRADKRVWDFATPLIANSEAALLEGLVKGGGWHFDFESGLWANIKNFGPNVGYTGCSIITSQYKYGSACLQIDSGANSLTYAAALTGSYTVMSWHRTTSWNHYAETYDGSTTTQYDNGAVNGGPAILCFDVSAGNVILYSSNRGGTDFTCQWDDLVILPYCVPLAFIAAVYAAGAAFSDLPNLLLSGDVLLDSAEIVEVRGKLGRTGHEYAKVDASPHRARIVNFQMIEV